MAKLTWVYELVPEYPVSSSSINCPNGKLISVKIRRKSPTNVNASLYSMSGTSGYLSSGYGVRIYGNHVYFKFGTDSKYGTSALFVHDEELHELSNVLVSNINSSFIYDFGLTQSDLKIIVSHGGGGNGMWLYNRCNLTLTVEVEKNNEVSTGTFASYVYTGLYLTVTINNSLLTTKSYKHTILLQLNASLKATANLAAGVSGGSVFVPTTWNSQIGVGNSATCTLRVKTYTSSGSYLGESQGTTTVYVRQTPVVVTPSTVSVTYSPSNTVSALGYNIVQGVTAVTITATFSPSSTQTASSYIYLLSDGQTYSQTYNGTSTSHQFAFIKTSGYVTCKVTVVDSTGARTQGETTLYSYAYSKPTVTGYSAQRSDASGNHDDEGTYINIKATLSYTSLTLGSFSNSATLKCRYRIQGNSTYSDSGKTDITNKLDKLCLIGGTLSKSASYEVVFFVQDSISGLQTVVVPVSATAYAIHVHNNNSGIAFGQASTGNGLLIAEHWAPKWGSYNIPRILYYTPRWDGDEPTGVTGLIWLKPKG